MTTTEEWQHLYEKLQTLRREREWQERRHYDALILMRLMQRAALDDEEYARKADAIETDVTAAEKAERSVSAQLALIAARFKTEVAA